MIQAMREAGKEAIVTIYSKMKHEHEVMNITYSNPDLYKWLLSKG